MPADALPIIDCHQHLWDLEKFKLPWIEPGTLLGRSYVMQDYLAAIEGTGIKHAVYMEVDVDPAQQTGRSGASDRDLQVRQGADDRRRRLRPTAADKFKDYITPLAKSESIKGIRQVLHGERRPPAIACPRVSSAAFNCSASWA